MSKTVVSYTGRTGQVKTELTYRIESRSQQPDLCTVFPRDTMGVKRMSTWITAEEGSYVTLETTR